MSSRFRQPQQLPGEQLETQLCAGLKMSPGDFEYVNNLAQDYLNYVLQMPQSAAGSSKTSRVLQNVAFSVQKEVEKNLKPCLDNLDVDSIDNAETIFRQVMEKEFEDGIINWGRIVTIFAFEGILIKKLLREQTVPAVDTNEVSSFVARFIMQNIAEWIKQNGGWEHGFVKKFEPRSGWLTFLEVTGRICNTLFLLKQYY